MDRPKSQLLCTFVGHTGASSTLHAIIKEFGQAILDGKIIVLKNKDTGLAYACVYNVVGECDEHQLRSTILIHRNRSTNTLYTINSLNLLNKHLNNGVHKENFAIPWEEYKQQMLLSNNNELNIVKTALAFIKHVD